MLLGCWLQQLLLAVGGGGTRVGVGVGVGRPAYAGFVRAWRGPGQGDERTRVAGESRVT